MRTAVVIVVSVFIGGCVPTAPDRLRELTDEGRYFYRQGAFDRARDSYQSALTLHPGNADLLYNLASCQARLGRQAEAEKLYEECLDRNPEHVEARHALISLMIESDRVDQARNLVRDWLTSSPQQAGPYIEDGWLRARDGDVDNASARYLQALDLEPRNPRALRELAQLYERLDRRDRAIVLYQRSLEADPDQPVVSRQVERLRAQGVGQPRPD